MNIELIKIVPSLLWFLLATGLVIGFRKEIRNLFARMDSVKVKGLEVFFVKTSIDAAIDLAQKHKNWRVSVSTEEKERAVTRAKLHLNLFKDAKILWVDDQPEAYLNERLMFLRLGVNIDTAVNTDGGLSLVSKKDYDLIISDMARGQEKTAGLGFLKRLRQTRKTPLIFYIGVPDLSKPVPPLSFGITNRPDELLHLVLDVLERRRNIT